MPQNKCFENQNTEKQIEFESSVETSFTSIAKPILETIYACKPKKPNLESCNSSKMPVCLIGEKEFITKIDKYRKQFKENKKSMISIPLHHVKRLLQRLKSN